MKDLIIIGAGPAGLTAGIYGIRAGLDLSVIEKFSPGGQVINTFEVENYPGFVEPIAGWELMSNMENQAKRLGVDIKNGDIVSLEKDEKGKFFRLKQSDGSVIETRSVIAATGASFRKLGVPGENEYTGKGVSYCATCDGAFYKEKTVAVIGGGNTALEEAHFLTRFASKIYLVHRRDRFRGVKVLQERVLEEEKIEPVLDTVLESIAGDQKVEKVVCKNKKTGEISELAVDGVFIFVGWDPNTSYLPEEVLNEKKEVVVDVRMHTKMEGLFAAGDLRTDSERQIVMAAADGATAALNVYDYLLDLN